MKELITAKNSAVNNYIKQAAVKATEEAFTIPESKLMKMRWAITLKEVPGQDPQVKARLCILGVQSSDTEEECANVDTPTPTRRGKMLFLQNCGWRRWRVKKGDVVGAFLQSATPLDKPQFCVPVPELATALGLKPGDPAEVAKAIYGLLRGPNLWLFGAVFTHLRENGWSHCYTDPCL